jgi:branched-chain amino acid transport system ATP-binding protein
MLLVEDVHAAYGAILALRGVSITVEEGELVGVVGVNGAGKSTLLKVISGVVKPVKGTILFHGESIVNRTPESIVRKGISLVPEGRHVFPSLTVRENLRIGAATRNDREGIQQDMDEMCDLFPILRERFSQVAGTLSGGEQQQLVIARALMSRPKLLMLDEPSLGLAPILVDSLFKMIEQLRELGSTILLVEQNVRRTLAIADRAYLMETGVVEFSGKSDELLQYADIESAYLGRSDESPAEGD